MSSITLHKELGVNPRIMKIHCEICGDTEDGPIILLGNKNYKVKCPDCQTWNLGGMTYDRGRRGYVCNNPRCHYIANSQPEKVELSSYEDMHSNGVCHRCEKAMEEAVAFICVMDEDIGKKNPRRTGQICFIRDEGVKKMVQPEELMQDIIGRRRCYVPNADWDDIGLPRGDVNNER